MENINEKELENIEEVIENGEEHKAIEDSDNPIDDISIANISNLMKQVAEMVQIMETNWNTSKNEFKLTDTHMKQLYQYNEEHRVEMPDGLTDEEKENWDRFNGLDNIPEEKLLEIFGEGHPIIGVANTQTIDRVKDCVNDFFNWLTTMKEYRQIHDAYIELLELEEEKNIEKLKLIAEKESDPDKKLKMEESIKLYYDRKHLNFLSEEMNDKDKSMLVNAFSDKNKIEYWLNRSREKLKQLKVSDKFILEISQFEKRYLPEKYHKCSNMLLLYFMKLIVYSNIGDKKDVDRNKSVCMIFALDGIIRNTWKGEVVDTIINNITNMLDQVIDELPDGVKEEN